MFNESINSKSDFHSERFYKRSRRRGLPVDSLPYLVGLPVTPGGVLFFSDLEHAPQLHSFCEVENGTL